MTVHQIDVSFSCYNLVVRRVPRVIPVIKMPAWEFVPVFVIVDNRFHFGRSRCIFVRNPVPKPITTNFAFVIILCWQADPVSCTLSVLVVGQHPAKALERVLSRFICIIQDTKPPFYSQNIPSCLWRWSAEHAIVLCRRKHSATLRTEPTLGESKTFLIARYQIIIYTVLA